MHYKRVYTYSELKKKKVVELRRIVNRLCILPATKAKLIDTILLHRHDRHMIPPYPRLRKMKIAELRKLARKVHHDTTKKDLIKIIILGCDSPDPSPDFDPVFGPDFGPDFPAPKIKLYSYFELQKRRLLI